MINLLMNSVIKSKKPWKIQMMSSTRSITNYLVCNTLWTGFTERSLNCSSNSNWLINLSLSVNLNLQSWVSGTISTRNFLKITKNLEISEIKSTNAPSILMNITTEPLEINYLLKKFLISIPLLIIPQNSKESLNKFFTT